jgi:hypothetical protein
MTRSWGRWGTDDQAGVVNLVTPEATGQSPGHRLRPSRTMNGDVGDAVEQQSERPGFPAPFVLLRQHGVSLIENRVLAALTATLGEAGRSMFVFAPLPLADSTGSPVISVVVL